MKFSEYLRTSQRTMPPNTTWEVERSIGTFGLVGEFGEIAEHFKKVLYHGAEFNRDHLLKELGDFAWYLACIARLAEKWDQWESWDKAHGSVEEIYNSSHIARDRFTYQRVKGYRDGLDPNVLLIAEYVYKMCGGVSDVTHVVNYHSFVLSKLYTVARIAHLCGSDLANVLQMNHDKLLRRYPNGFDTTIAHTHDSQ